MIKIYKPAKPKIPISIILKNEISAIDVSKNIVKYVFFFLNTIVSTINKHINKKVMIGNESNINGNISPNVIDKNCIKPPVK